MILHSDKLVTPALLGMLKFEIDIVPAKLTVNTNLVEILVILIADEAVFLHQALLLPIIVGVIRLIYAIAAGWCVGNEIDPSCLMFGGGIFMRSVRNRL